MKNNPVLTTTLILAVLLAVGMVWRIQQRQNSFENLVHESLQTSAGYDKKFIDLVNRLEDILATRASFGYSGNKDPMTGKMRIVVRASSPYRAAKVKKVEKDTVDPVKLTAIIQDDDGAYTAIVMDEDRSQAVTVGEIVHGRKINMITGEALYMEDDSLFYKYDISGQKHRKPKVLMPKPIKPEPGSSGKARKVPSAKTPAGKSLKKPPVRGGAVPKPKPAPEAGLKSKVY